VVALGVFHLPGLEVVKNLELISRVDEDPPRPVWRNVIVNTVFPFCHETEIMPCTPNGPEQVWIGVLRHGDKFTIWEHQTGRDNLIGHESVLALEPIVAASGRLYVKISPPMGLR
jgi:hypothetical protein